MRAPTGEQFDISRTTSAGRADAVVTQLGASLRGYSVGGVELTEPYAEDQATPMGCGLVLVPWPNRVKDGCWELNGTKQQLALTEPARDNAIHGLLRFSPYTVAERTESAITLAATVFPQLGYPFHLDTSVRYELVDDGLTVTHELTNLGDADAPVAVGAHPYLKIGDVPTGDLTLTLNALTHIDVDDRLNVIGHTPVEGTQWDWRGGTQVGDLSVDDGWGDVVMTDAGSEQTLTADDGRSVSVWADTNFGYVQVFTTNDFPNETVSDVAIAIEPMTAPTNALNSGRGIHALSPGDTWSVSWGIRHAGFAA